MKKPDFKSIIKGLPEMWHEVLLQILNTTYELGAESVDRWIPVSNQPEKTGHYIALDANKGLVSCKYYDKDKNTWNTPLGAVTYVTDWQYLPVAPKGKIAQNPVEPTKERFPMPVIGPKMIMELPNEFTFKDALALGELLGVGSKTVSRVLAYDEFFTRIKPGKYIKKSASVDAIKSSVEKPAVFEKKKIIISKNGKKVKSRGSNTDHANRVEELIKLLPINFDSSAARKIGKKLDLSPSSVWRTINIQDKFHKLGGGKYAKIV
jgi:hypothetical protein